MKIGRFTIWTRKVEMPAEKLERIVRETRESYEIRRYRERRIAALKGWQRRREAVQ